MAIERRTALCKRRRNSGTSARGPYEAVASGIKEGPAMVHQPVRDPAARQIMSCSTERSACGSLPVQTLCSFLDRNRASRWTGGAPRADPAADRWWARDGTRESEAGGRGETLRQDKASPHPRRKSMSLWCEVMKHALCGVLRGLTTAVAHVRCRRACCRTPGRAVVGVPIVGALVTAILSLGPHVNLSPSAPRGLYRAAMEPSTQGARVAPAWVPRQRPSGVPAATSVLGA